MHDPQQAPAPQAHRAAVFRRYLHFFGIRVEKDVDEELTFHLDMLVRDLVARGMPPADARAEALRRFGDPRRTRKSLLSIGHRRQRRMIRARIIDELRQDVAFAIRTLARQPGWALIAVLTLGLGIGASTAVFSVVNAVVLRPLPYRHADRLVLVWRADPKGNAVITPDDELIDAWKKSAHSFESIEEYGQGSVTLSGDGAEPAVVLATWMQRDFPRFAGIPLLLGRTFSAEEAADSASRVALIGEGLWRQRFAASTAAIGGRITIDAKPYTIIGVTRGALRVPSLMQPGPTDVWLPLAAHSSQIAHLVMARLRPGITIDAATRELTAIQSHVPSIQKLSSRSYVPKLLTPGHFNGWHDSLTLLSVAVALLLLIACANVAHLLLARGATRGRELAIRAALGASRARIRRQLATESALLAVAGCGAGLLVARLGLSMLVKTRPSDLAMQQLTYVAMDGRVLALAVLLTVITALLFGFIGAAHVARQGTAESLKSASRTGTTSRAGYRTRSFLVVSEMALSAMLLVGAVLLVRSVINLQHVDPGFDMQDLYSMDVELPARLTADSTALSRFARTALDDARRIPGARAVTVAASAPPKSTFMIGQLEAQGRPAPTDLGGFTAVNQVRPEYFSVMGIRLLHGRGFDAGSVQRGEVIVNEGLARKFWPGGSAIGQHIRIASPYMARDATSWMTIVGVVGDAVVRGLADDRSDPFIYSPSENGTGWSGFTLIVRASAGVDVTTSMRRIAASLDRTLAPPPVVSVEHAFESTIATQRFTMFVLAMFAVLAAILAAVGLYGVMAYMVAQRTREIGIRIALGASARQIARVVAGGGVLLSVAGLILGLVGSYWGTRIIQKTLFGVGATDPGSFAAAGSLLLAVSIVACLVPMRRALRVDPMIAMRAD